MSDLGPDLGSDLGPDINGGTGNSGGGGGGSDTTPPTAPTVVGAASVAATVTITLTLAPGTDPDDQTATLTYNIYRDSQKIATGIAGPYWSETVAANNTSHSYGASMSDPAGNEGPVMTMATNVLWAAVLPDLWAVALGSGYADGTAGALLRNAGKLMLDSSGRVNLNLLQPLDPTLVGETVGGAQLAAWSQSFGPSQINDGVETRFASDGTTEIATLVYDPPPSNASRA